MKQGTIVRIEDLFYNVPQRRHCLHSISEECQRICDVVAKYAVHYPNVAFTLQKWNHKPLIKTNLRSTKEQNIRSLYGAQIADHLMSLEIESSKYDTLKINALFTSVEYFTKSFNIILFINHRLVESQAVKVCVEKAYSGHIPKGMYPFTYIELEMNAMNVDVNVHPTKLQVKFLYEEEITELIRAEFQKKLLPSKEKKSLYKELQLSRTQIYSSEAKQRSFVKLFEKDIMRADTKEQKLETFLSHRLLKTAISNNLAYRSSANFFQGQTFKKTRLSSIIRIQKKITDATNIVVRKTMKNLVFVGIVDESNALIQFQTSLFMCNTIKLSEELFFQRLIYNFQNIISIKIKPKLSVKKLIHLALSVKNKNKKKTDCQINQLTFKYTTQLKKNNIMMQEYFGLYINAAGELEALPALLSNHKPCLSFLPNYLLSLATEINWKNEEECFETFSRQTARFYALTTHLNTKERIKENKIKIEHIIYPALKRFLLPSESLKLHIKELTNLSKLYKVFERC